MQRKEVDLEFLPPNPKYECFKCKKRFSHVWHCKDGNKRCTTCKKWMVTNKFYITFKHKSSDKIGKFSLSDVEKEQLAEQYKRLGMDSIRAWNRVNEHCRMLRRSYWGMRARRAIDSAKDINRQDDIKHERKKFMDGLK